MAESITDVATASNKQLLAVDDASKSMDVLMEKIGGMAHNARRAAVETKQATEKAQNGNAVVTRTVKDMARLSEVVGESARVATTSGNVRIPLAVSPIRFRGLRSRLTCWHSMRQLRQLALVTPAVALP